MIDTGDFSSMGSGEAMLSFDTGEHAIVSMGAGTLDAAATGSGSQSERASFSGSGGWCEWPAPLKDADLLLATDSCESLSTELRLVLLERCLDFRFFFLIFLSFLCFFSLRFRLLRSASSSSTAGGGARYSGGETSTLRLCLTSLDRDDLDDTESLRSL